MLSELGTVSNSYQTTPKVAAVVARPSETGTTVDAEETVGNPNSQVPVSPRIKVDPTVGVILQFLDESGQVESQVPSFAAVAYLRAGLTREGYDDDKGTVV